LLKPQNVLDSITPLIADLVLFTFILIRFFRTYRVARMQRIETAHFHGSTGLRVGNIASQT
jgi:hypothetical protein